MFPELSSAANAIEANNEIEPVKVNLSSSMEWECLRRKHKVYSFLAKGLSPFINKHCISKAIAASSTDRWHEGIENTLEAGDLGNGRSSYWCSKGESDPAVPETLLYRLRANLCGMTQSKLTGFRFNNLQ